MTDATIRELQRAAQAAPADGRARLAFAQALARAGRKREALDALDLASAPDEHFAELKGLSDALWHEEIASFRLGWEIETALPRDIVFDASSELVGWRYRNLWPNLAIASLRTGRMLFQDEGEELLPGNGQVTVLSFHEGAVARRVCEPDGVGPWVQFPNWPGDCVVEGTAHNGDAVLLSDESVYEWPSLRVLATAMPPSHMQAVIDWTNRCVLMNDYRAESCYVTPFENGAPWEISLMPASPLGHGVIGGPRWFHAEVGIGWAIYDLERRRMIEVLGEGDYAPLSLARDRRGLRLMTGDICARFELDRAAGSVRRLARAAPPGPVDGDRSPVWHPDADVWLVSTGAGAYELRALEPGVLGTVAGPRAVWTPDGHALLVIAPDRLQLWRAPG